MRRGKIRAYLPRACGCASCACLPACLPVLKMRLQDTGEALRGTALRPGAAQRGHFGASPLANRNHARATLSRDTPPLKCAPRALFQVLFVPVAFREKVGAATGRWGGRIERGCERMCDKLRGWRKGEGRGAGAGAGEIATFAVSFGLCAAAHSAARPSSILRRSSAVIQCLASHSTYFGSA